MTGQSAKLSWREGGVPVSTRFDDPYFSVADGLAETRHVFLDGNDLPARFAPGFHVAELGFGTGLNALAAWALWRDWAAETGETGPLRFTSFEAFPMTGAEMARALAAFPALKNLAAPFVSAWEAGPEIRLDGLALDVIVGDVRQTLPGWQGTADAWFLDGFSPAKNPEMWGTDLMAEVARHTARGGTFATYSAAGFVRRGLQDAGFEVMRVPGFRGKRHMSIGRLR